MRIIRKHSRARHIEQDFTDQALERQFCNERIGRFGITTDLTRWHGGGFETTSLVTKVSRVFHAFTLLNCITFFGLATEDFFFRELSLLFNTDIGHVQHWLFRHWHVQHQVLSLPSRACFRVSVATHIQISTEQQVLR